MNTVPEFYTNCVKKQLNGDECTQSCAQEIQALKQQLAISKDKLTQTKIAINTCKRIIEKKNRKVESLQQQINEQCAVQQDELLFSAHENEFSSDGLSELRSIGGKPTEDSKFILIGMRFLYKNQLQSMQYFSNRWK